MMEDARRHKFSVVLVAACDRLARSTKHLLQVARRARGSASSSSPRERSIRGPPAGQLS